MTDFALTWKSAAQAADLSVTENDLSTDAGLEGAIMLSLFTDRRADEGDVLPDGQQDRRGWWGDSLPVAVGDKFGSRLWLLDRSKRLPVVLDRARAYALEALQWLLDDRVAESVTVRAQFLPVPLVGLGLEVSVARARGDVALFRFGQSWGS